MATSTPSTSRNSTLIRPRSDDDEGNNHDSDNPNSKKVKVDPKILDGKYFNIKKREGDRVQAACTICGALRWGSLRGTGNFTRHIKEKHQEKQLEMYNYLKIYSSEDGNDNKAFLQTTIKMYTSCSDQQICNLLLDLIIETNTPFRIVQSESLKNLLCSVAGRGVQMPSVYKIMAALDLRFSEMKIKLIAVLGNQQTVCLTADIWTHMRKSFLGISLHYIDEKWQRQSYILAFRYLNKRHTYDYLARVLNEIMVEYNLPNEKVSHIVTDGGSNFCKAFNVYGRNTDFSQTLMSLELNQGEDRIEESDNAEANNLLEGRSEDALESEAQAVIEESNIEGYQIDLTSDPEDIDIDIVLPPQMRCFAHLLNLIGKVIVFLTFFFEKYFFYSLFRIGKADFLQELEQCTQSYNFFMAAYSKLKVFWNKAARSTHVSAKIKELMKCAIVTPTQTRWNSEWDAMKDAHDKRVGVCCVRFH